ncbi:hypothetical protein [Streptomyces olivaceus]|uniref:hypothetical protein n=1 Tax=Streptomyces olivaceus TaxID=47716 RepID=UPI004055DE87
MPAGYAAALARAGAAIPGGILALVAGAVGVRLPILHRHAAEFIAAHSELYDLAPGRATPAAAWLRWGGHDLLLLTALGRLLPAVRANLPGAERHLARALLTETGDDILCEAPTVWTELATGPGGAAAASRLLAAGAPRQPGPGGALLESAAPTSAQTCAGDVAERAAHPREEDALLLAAHLLTRAALGPWYDIEVRAHARILLLAAEAPGPLPAATERLRLALVGLARTPSTAGRVGDDRGMTDGLPGGSAPGPPSRPDGPSGGREELRVLAAPRLRTVDEPMFTAPGLPGTFRLQLFTAAGARPVAVATQVPGEGMGLMNGAERYAGAVWERHCPEREVPPVWVERQLWPGSVRQESRWRRVVFAGADGYRPHGPRWTAITHQELEDMVGAEVASDRGDGYVPRPADPGPRLVFEEFAVVRLGRPRPFREPDCMPAGVPWWRRRLRQVLPRRGAQPCCWYHGGDWHMVSAMAIEVLRRARAQGVEADDMEEFGVVHAAAVGATGWESEALASLFSTADAIQPDSEGGYVNGQHRGQALLEAGVRRTVVLRHVYEP